MKRTGIISLTLLLAAILLSGCNLVGGLVGGNDTVEGLADSLVSFPDSLAGDTTSAQVQSASTVEPQADATATLDYVDYVYTPVRDAYNPIAQSAIDFVAETLQSLEENVLSNGFLMNRLDNQGVISGYEENDTRAWRVTKDEGEIYTVELWAQTDGVWTKELHMDVESSGEGWKGTIVARGGDNDSGNRPLYEVVFDANDPDRGKITTLRAVDLQSYDAADPQRSENVPTKLWMEAFEAEDTFSVNAAINYTHIDIEDASPFREEFLDVIENDGSDGFTSSNLVASYVYQGIASLTADRGAVSLALVPSNVDSNESIFTDFSYGSIYTQAIGDWTRTNPNVDDAGENLINAVNWYLARAGNPVPDISTASTDAEVFAAFEAIRDWADSAGEDTSDLDAILFVVEVVNPGYYISTGFVGTAALETPSWAGELAASQNDFNGSVGVTAQEIAGDGFSVQMEGPAEPDF